QARFQILILRPRHARIRPGVGLRLDLIEAAAVVDARDGMQQHRLDPREPRGVHADADAERQDHDGRESGHAADRAKGVTNQSHEKVPSLSPKLWRSSCPSVCTRLSITFDSGVPFFAFRCTPPVMAPPPWPATRKGTRL